ncbi:MAG: hypothetical protein R2822_00035 [Spirosomataceae bacterium]
MISILQGLLLPGHVQSTGTLLHESRWPFYSARYARQWSGTPSVVMPLSVCMAIIFIISGKEASGKLSDIATFFFVIGYTSRL